MTWIDNLRAHPRWAIVALGLVILLPFCRRPLFVDDHAVFMEARDLGHHLMRPYSNQASIPGWGSHAFVGEDNPLVYFYFLAAVIKFLGSEIWKSHLAMIPIHILGLLAFFMLAKRYVRHPLWATVLWLFSPHFWLTANALLVDGMLGSLMIMGIASWINGMERQHFGRLFMGAILLGLTPLVKYTGLLSWGVIALWMTLEKRLARDWTGMFLLLPLALFGSWLGWTHHLYGHDHFTAVAQSRMVFPHPAKAATLALYAVATTPCLLFLIPIFLNGSIRQWHCEKEEFFLIGWIILGLTGLAFALDWVCARFMIIIGPAFVLFSVRTLEQYSRAARSSTFRGFSAGLLGLFTLALACADYSQAVVDPTVAKEAAAWLEQNPGHHGRTCFPAAALGGLSFYLPTDAWQPVPPGATLARSDILLFPLRTLPRTFLPRCAKLERLAEFTFPTKNPLRTLDTPSGAGFYGSIWGPWPYTLSAGPREVYWLAVCQE